MTDKILVKFLQIVALDRKWEAAFHKALDDLDPKGEYTRLASDADVIDLCILAYPAADHEYIVEHKLLAERLTTLNSSADIRLVLFACEKSRPKVTKSLLATLAREQVPPSFFNINPDLVVQTRDAEVAVAEYLELTLRNKGLWLEYSTRSKSILISDDSSSREILDELCNQ